jgi:CubicO group peptidase (beta-lactamase class C family)
MGRRSDVQAAMLISRRTLLQGSLLSVGTMARGSWPAFAQAPAASPTADERTRMAELATDFMGANNIPALSIAIAIRGKPAYVEAFCVADRMTGEAVTPQHRFRIASISKTITATGIFTLIEAGKLRLDAYVFGPDSVLGTDYPTPPSVQSLMKADALRSFNEQITIEHLLTHTTGAWPHGSGDPLRRNREMTHRQLIAWTLEHMPLTTAPGEKFAYSNFGYVILGRVIEKLTGQPYEQYIKDNLLTRCGITGMQMAKNGRAGRASREVKYYDISATYDPYTRDVERLDACGGWIGTPSDLTNFFVHIDGFKDTEQLLSDDTLRVMTTPSAANPRYAKGLFIDRREGRDNWWHDGLLDGTTTVAVRTGGDFCWSAFTNAGGANNFTRGLGQLMWTMTRAVPGWNPNRV